MRRNQDRNNPSPGLQFSCRVPASAEMKCASSRINHVVTCQRLLADSRQSRLTLLKRGKSIPKRVGYGEKATGLFD